MSPNRPVVLLAAFALLCPPVRSAAPDTPARVEVGLRAAAAANPPIGCNEFGDPGGTRFSGGNLIPDGGFEPLSGRHRVRVRESGTENGYTWITVGDQEGMAGWDSLATGFMNGASVRIYRVVDAVGNPLPQQPDNSYLDLANAAAFQLVATTSVPEAGAPNLPLGGWVDTGYSRPGGGTGTRTNTSFTDDEWAENGTTYYYTVTTIGTNDATRWGVNESDRATSPEVSATPLASATASPHIAIEYSRDDFGEIGNAQAGQFFEFRPRAVGATGAVTWALLDAANAPIAPPAGLVFNSATGELRGTPAATPAATFLRFRVSAANGAATRDFILNNPDWAVTGGTTRPASPTGLTATAGPGYVHLSWNAVPGAAGYHVYRSVVPRAQQRQRIYFAPGTPVLVKDDYVYLAKRVLAADTRWAHPRLRAAETSETWRDFFNNHCEFVRTPHPAPLPAEFRFPGESCLRVTAVNSNVQSISGPYMFWHQEPDQAWYGQLEPGRTYRYEAWLRQSGLGNGGRVTLTLSGDYGPIAHTFAVDDQWRLHGFEFTAPARPTSGGAMCPIINFTGPGQLWMDNLRLFRADTPAAITSAITPGSPFVLDELRASQPLTGEKGMLRYMYVLLNRASMASSLGLHHDAHLAISWYQGADAVGTMTLPHFLQNALVTGATPATRMKPWLNVSSHATEQEWLMLMEYLAAPIDPANPADVAAKPWAFLRYQQRGVTTPWTDEFPRLYVEFANETWHNGAVHPEWVGWGRSGYIHDGAREFGLMAHYYSSYLRTHSPHFTAAAAAGKISLVIGSNYSDYGERAAPLAPFVDSLAHTTYVGPKWETGETPLATYDDHGIQATLLGHATDTTPSYELYRLWREQAATAGHPMELLGYEGGPSGYALPTSDASGNAREYSERYGKSLAMAVAALDAWLGAHLYGFSDQGYLAFLPGTGWTSHTTMDGNMRPHAGWLALTLRNRFASGRLVDTAVTQAPTIEWDAREIPLVSAYTFRDGRRLGVLLLSRKLGGVHDGVDWGDGSTPVTIALPANPVAPATLYHLSGDPRATNREALNLSIQQTTATLGRETTVTLPQGSIYLYVVDTDLPDITAAPATPNAPALTYASTGTTLTWPALPGATGYRVYRSTTRYFQGGTAHETFDTTTNTFIDTGAVGGTTYYYRVAALTAWGEGFWSLGTPGGLNPAAPPLAAPALHSLAESDSTLTANWAPVPGATTYRVGLATRSGGPYTWSDAGMATSWTFAGLTNASTYYATVYALGPSGRSANSAERTGVPIAAGTSTVLAAWEAADLIYHDKLDNPPLVLPVRRSLGAVVASEVTRGPGFVLATELHGYALDPGEFRDTSEFDGTFGFSPPGEWYNFGTGGSLAVAVTRGMYLAATLTPAAGQSISLDALDTGFRYPWGGVALELVLQFRIGGGVWESVPATGYQVMYGRDRFNDVTVALSGVAALRDIQQPVELRLYLFAPGDNAQYHSATMHRSSGDDLLVRGSYRTVAAPGAPSGLHALAGARQILLAWDAVPGASTYTVRWGTTPGVYTGILTGLTQATATITALPGGVPHFFVVEAVNAFGSGPTRAPVSATPLTAFQAWQNTHFTTAQLVAGVGAANADPDADGQPNLVEYAFGTAPLAAGAAGYQIATSGSPARLVATLPLWSEHDDLVITVEASTDLLSWTPLARSAAGAAMNALIDGVQVSSAGTSPTIVNVTDLPSGTTDATARRFFRVTVSTL